VLKFLEGFEGAEVHAAGGFDAALEAGEGFEGVLIGVAEGGIVLEGGVDKFVAGEVLVQGPDLVGPEFGLDAAEAALGPLGGDEGIDKGELVGSGGPVVAEKRGGEGFEFGGVFAGNNVGAGMDAGFERVEGGSGFAFGGSGAG
jgi:hypothetical protein